MLTTGRAEIPRIELSTASSFEALVRARLPVVIPGAVAAWPALERWRDPAALAARAPDHSVMLERRVAGDYHDFETTERVPSTLGAFARFLADPHGPQLYMPGAHIGRELPELVGDFTRPQVLANLPVKQTTLFWGHGSNATNHFHSWEHALLCQVVGDKRATLFAPGDTANLYPMPVTSHAFARSQVQLDAPDLTRFPRFARARAHETLLRPGDALFLPLGWWHEMVAVGNSMSVSFFWDDARAAWSHPVRSLRSSLAGLLHHGRATRLVRRLTER